jgi:hypothetical protein
MKRGAALRIAATGVLMAALAACDPASVGHKNAGAGSSGGPPPGGWPQPVNGQLTTNMCGLLTNADYAKYGHERLPAVSQKRVENEPNAVECMYMTSDELTMNVQPTIESARLEYAESLKDHKQRLAEDHRASILATNVVPGADESWFDYWTIGTSGSKYTEYEIRVRRHALIVGIVLSGLKGKHEQDPRVVLSGLAGLVLQRIPNVGLTDTGKTLKARFSVIGQGRAKQIVYSDPSTSKSTTLKNVKLPWHVDKSLITLGRPLIMLSVSATSSAPMAMIGCNIQVEGETLEQQAPMMGFTTCLESYKPPK